MSFPCHACGKHSLPHSQLQIWREHIYSRTRNAPNTYTSDSPSFRIIANKLLPYAESLRKELEAVNEILQPALELSAPISKVPDDILLYIFEELFPIDINGVWTKARDVYPYIFVCKRWRNVITSFPKFWTRIPMLPMPHNSSFWPTMPSSVPPCTIPLAVDFSPHLPSDPPYCLRQISNRVIYYINLETDRRYPNEAFEILSYLPQLNRLSFTVLEYPASMRSYGWDEESDGDELREGIDFVAITLPGHKTPHLTNIELRIERRLDEITLPWAQLKVLRLHQNYESYYDPCCLVNGLRDIEELELDIDCSDYDSAVGRLQITLPNLRVLSLNGDSSGDFAPQLIRQSGLPSLKELNYKLSGGYEGFVMAMSNNSQLRNIVSFQLELDIPSYSSESNKRVKDVMNSFWTLESLETFSCSVNTRHKDLLSVDHVLEAISQKDSSMGHLFPYLRTLRINSQHFDMETVGSIQELLNSRVSGTDVASGAKHSLRSVHIALERWPDFKPPPLNTQVYRPSCYNNRVATVVVEVNVPCSDRLEDEMVKTLEGL